MNLSDAEMMKQLSGILESQGYSVFRNITRLTYVARREVYVGHEEIITIDLEIYDQIQAVLLGVYLCHDMQTSCFPTKIFDVSNWTLEMFCAKINEATEEILKENGLFLKYLVSEAAR